MNGRPSRADLVLLAAVGATLVVRLATHEPWFDELQSWSIVRGNSIPGLLRALRYESHPPLWYLVLWPVSRITQDPHALQAVQFLQAMGVAILVVCFSPFRRWQQAALLFGYFFGFEWGALSRSYGLGALLLLAAVAAATRPVPRWGLAGSLLGLTCLTSVFGILVAGAVALGLFVAGRRLRLRLVVPAAIGAAAAVLTLVPAPDVGRSANYVLTGALRPRAIYATGQVWRALVPIPSSKRWPWNTNVLDPGYHVVQNWLTDTAYNYRAQSALGLLLVVAVAALLWRRPAALTTWLCGVAALSAFAFFIRGFSLRHTGHFFLVLVAALWMAAARDERDLAPCPSPGPAVLGTSLVAVLMASQVMGAIGITARLHDRPFSNARAAAGAIHGAGLDDRVVVVDDDVGTSAVAAWLERPVWFANARRFGRYPVFDARRERGGGDVTLGYRVLDAARRAPNPGGRPLVLVLAYQLETGPGLTLVAEIGADLALEHGYEIYLYDPARYRGGR